MEIEFKDSFIDRYSKLTDFDKFKDISLTPLPRTIRINTLKSNVDEVVKRLKKDWKLKKIKFSDIAFEIEHRKKERRDIGNIKEHFLGYFYVQEAASLLPPMVLDVNEEDKVLDVAASPGSKTTQMAAMMKNKGIIVANEVKYQRLKPLSINLQRCGVLNTVLSLGYGQRIKGEYDKILLDAPCSGTGAIRKSLKTLQIYNRGMIKKLSYDQRDILFNSFKILKRKGTLVYSTCSLEPEENEGVVNSLLEKNDDAYLEEIKIKNLKKSEIVRDFEGKAFNKEIEKCLRIWPQDNNTEGFFVAKIRKK